MVRASERSLTRRQEKQAKESDRLEPKGKPPGCGLANGSTRRHHGRPAHRSNLRVTHHVYRAELGKLIRNPFAIMAPSHPGSGPPFRVAETG